MSLRRIVVAAVLALSLLPIPAAQAADQVGLAGRLGASPRSSVHYDDALRHAGDRIHFKAGGRVTVPYRPRPGDDWTVDGGAPKALPAGTRSGADIAAALGGAARPPGSPPPGSVVVPGAEVAPTLSDPRPLPRLSDPRPQPAVESPASWMSERLLSAPVASGGLRREVFGFLPYWELTDASTRLDYSVLSTIAYFGVGADKDGHLIRKRADGSRDVGWAGWTSSALTAVINEAHAKRTRVVLTVQRFAWTTSQVAATKALLGDAEARTTLATQIAKAVADRGADGVNLDFEPIPGGYGDEYVAFVRLVRKALDARADGYQLTFDATGSIGAYDIAALTGRDAADAVFIMGYDYRTSGAANAGSISPLSGPRYDLTDTVDAYLARIDPGQIILGVPYYGRAWSTTSDAPNGRTRAGSSTTGYSTSVLYTTAVETAAKQGRRWDATESSPWSAYRWKACPDCPTTWRELYYDDARSLGLKYDLVNARGLRGAGIWALGYDGSRPELYALLKSKFRGDSTAPSAGVVLLPSTTRDATIQVRWTGRDDGAIDRYDVQVSADGGPWSTWLEGTTRTSATYRGLDGHGYAYRVRARDKQGHWSAWNVTDTWRAKAGSLKVGAFVRVTADALAMRASPDTSARRVGTVAPGARLRIVGGPRKRDGFTWHKVVGPLKEWGPVSGTTRSGVWVTTFSGTRPRVRLVPAPNTTTLDVLVDDLAIGAVDVVKATRSTSTGSRSSLPAAFSPGGDKVRDGLRISYRLDASVDALTLRVLRAADGATVGSRSLPARTRGRHVFDWNGTIGGKRLADGIYHVQLVARLGSTTGSAPTAAMADPTFDLAAWTATIDTSAPILSEIKTGPGALSPDGDHRQDSLALTASAGPGTARWQLRIRGRDGVVLRTFAGSDRAVRATWDGRDAAGRRVADGTYRVELSADDALGNTASTTAAIAVDTVDPVGSAAAVVPGLVAGATRHAFSPDGDGWQDAVVLRVDGGEPVRARIAVRNAAGRTVWARDVPLGATPGTTWKGRDTSGHALRDGSYRIVATVTDAAGNRAVLGGKVRIDRTAGNLRVRPSLFFPQDGDRLAATTRATFTLRDRALTTLRVLAADGAVVRTAWTRRARARGRTTWTWDGRDAKGALLPRGRYLLELVATAGGVSQVVRRGLSLDAFAISPGASPLTPGSRLSLVIASAEPLRGAPLVTLAQRGLAARTLTARRRVDGRFMVTFELAKGVRGTAVVTVKGTDITGRPNSATQQLSIR